MEAEMAALEFLMSRTTMRSLPEVLIHDIVSRRGIYDYLRGVMDEVLNDIRNIFDDTDFMDYRYPQKVRWSSEPEWRGSKPYMIEKIVNIEERYVKITKIEDKDKHNHCDPDHLYQLLDKHKYSCEHLYQLLDDNCQSEETAQFEVYEYTVYDVLCYNMEARENIGCHKSTLYYEEGDDDPYIAKLIREKNYYGKTVFVHL